jgi:hypothetical protein
MVATFAPQFFLLIGIDLFLAASIISTLLEEHYPKALGYVFDIASFVGFAQLWSGPEFLKTFGDNIQFYLCIGYALIATMSIVAANLYLLVIKRKRVLSILFTVMLTMPGSLILLFFTSAYVNVVPIELPVLPRFSWEQIYVLFAASAILLVILMVFSLRPHNRKQSRQKEA